MMAKVGRRGTFGTPGVNFPVIEAQLDLNRGTNEKRGVNKNFSIRVNKIRIQPSHW